MNNHPVFIIAEAGVNHNGRMSLAKQLVDVAVDAGADAVKFQSFVTEEELVERTPKAEYQKRTTNSTESQFDMVKVLELDKQQHIELMAYCDDKGIEFMSSPFDLVSIALLAELGVRRIKIPSGEITNVPYLTAIAGLKLPVILSTGMSYIEEVEFAVNTLLAGGLADEKISILHCTSEYPSPVSNVNLFVLNTLQTHFSKEVGYSDHTLGCEVAVAAVALGARIIEKHITLSRTMAGPDHAASMEPQEFNSLVRQIRNIEVALGCATKQPSEAEIATRNVVRKRIVAKRTIFEGEIFDENNITTKRAPDGLGAHLWHDVIGKRSDKKYERDESVAYEN